MKHLNDEQIASAVGGFDQFGYPLPSIATDPFAEQELNEWRDRLRDEASMPSDDI